MTAVDRVEALTVVPLHEVADPGCPTCHGSGLAAENLAGGSLVAVPCWCVLALLTP